jgi:hypothetical protein
MGFIRYLNYILLITTISKDTHSKRNKFKNLKEYVIKLKIGMKRVKSTEDLILII